MGGTGHLHRLGPDRYGKKTGNYRKNAIKGSIWRHPMYHGLFHITTTKEYILMQYTYRIIFITSFSALKQSMAKITLFSLKNNSF
jgi:hypothetical protein